MWERKKNGRWGLCCIVECKEGGNGHVVKGNEDEDNVGLNEGQFGRGLRLFMEKRLLLHLNCGVHGILLVINVASSVLNHHMNPRCMGTKETRGFWEVPYEGEFVSDCEQILESSLVAWDPNI